MSLTLSTSQIKEKAGVDSSEFDSEIDNLLDAWTPVIEYAIADEFLADTANVGLQATLTLGAAELIAGEFLAQLGRRPGAMDSIRIESLSLEPFAFRNPLDPSGLKQQALVRLRMFLKTDPTMFALASVGTGTKPQ